MLDFLTAGEERLVITHKALDLFQLGLEVHGGEIDVDSEPGEGTTFELRFPVWQEDSIKDE